MMTVQAYNSEIRQYVWDSVMLLLDNYYLYGFLYDKHGNLKPEYINVGCEILWDGSEGPLKDAEGYEIVSEKFLVEDLLGQPVKYQMINQNLDVHCNVHFDMKDWRDIKYMNNSKIKRLFIRDSMEQLIGMLRRGHNYAMILPVAQAVSDEYLEDTICFVWKMLVLDTMNVHDVKKKYFVPGHEYYRKGEDNDYAWDSRPYYDRITDIEDVVSHNNGKITFKYNTNQNHHKTAEELEAKRKADEQRMLKIIEKSLSPSDKEKNFVNHFSEQVTKDFSDINSADYSANTNSIARRMAHIYKIY